MFNGCGGNFVTLSKLRRQPLELLTECIEPRTRDPKVGNDKSQNGPYSQVEQ